MNAHNKLSQLLISSLLMLGLPGPAAAFSEEWDNTFSIVARDPVTGALGAAVSTARLAVGNRVLHVEHNVGAIATQANTNPLLAKEALQRLQNGVTAKDALDAVLQADEKRDERQLSIIDAKGTGTKGATHHHAQGIKAGNPAGHPCNKISETAAHFEII